MLYIFYLVTTLYLIPLFVIFRYFWRKEMDIQQNSTESTQGVVVDYKSWTGVKTPIVEYVVDNIKYRNFLSYSTHISAPLGMDYPREKEELRKTLLILTVIYNVNTLPYSFQSLWPLGTEMTVYYNPNNPKRSYVERYAGMVNYFKNATLLCGSAQVILTLIVVGISLFRLLNA
ncbi:DUF3592 domain-containing protein [Streptococcus iners]